VYTRVRVPWTCLLPTSRSFITPSWLSPATYKKNIHEEIKTHGENLFAYHTWMHEYWAQHQCITTLIKFKEIWRARPHEYTHDMIVSWISPTKTKPERIAEVSTFSTFSTFSTVLTVREMMSHVKVEVKLWHSATKLVQRLPAISYRNVHANVAVWRCDAIWAPTHATHACRFV
jgi:hypothetical protein